jgi:hypothetical protein
LLLRRAIALFERGLNLFPKSLHFPLVRVPALLGLAPPAGLGRLDDGPGEPLPDAFGDLPHLAVRQFVHGQARQGALDLLAHLGPHVLRDLYQADVGGDDRILGALDKFAAPALPIALGLLLALPLLRLQPRPLTSQGLLAAPGRLLVGLLAGPALARLLLGVEGLVGLLDLAEPELELFGLDLLAGVADGIEPGLRLLSLRLVSLRL